MISGGVRWAQYDWSWDGRPDRATPYRSSVVRDSQGWGRRASWRGLREKRWERVVEVLKRTQPPQLAGNERDRQPGDSGGGSPCRRVFWVGDWWETTDFASSGDAIFRSPLLLPCHEYCSRDPFPSESARLPRLTLSFSSFTPCAGTLAPPDPRPRANPSSPFSRRPHCYLCAWTPCLLAHAFKLED